MSLTIQMIKDEIARRKPEELPVVLDSKEVVVGFYKDRMHYAYDENMGFGHMDEEALKHKKILPPSKRKKVLYQAVIKDKHFEEVYFVGKDLYRDEQDSKNVLGNNFVKLLTDRPIEIEGK